MRNFMHFFHDCSQVCLSVDSLGDVYCFDRPVDSSVSAPHNVIHIEGLWADLPLELTGRHIIHAHHLGQSEHVMQSTQHPYHIQEVNLVLQKGINYMA